MSGSTCEFCKIVHGETERYVVFENGVSLAFLDLRPLFPGHLLLVPKQHYETLTALPAELVAPLFASARLLARAVEEALGAHGSFVAINNRISQSVPHLQSTLYPAGKKTACGAFTGPGSATPIGRTFWRCRKPCGLPWRGCRTYREWRN